MCTERRGRVELLIEGRSRDLGGFCVRRVLPAPAHRTVGPFIFLDEMGPADFAPGEPGIAVRPHPHIGLATVTFLFSGEILHRDSLGWNFVHSSAERIERAKADWRDGAVDRVPGDDELIPLPEN